MARKDLTPDLRGLAKSPEENRCAYANKQNPRSTNGDFVNSQISPSESLFEGHLRQPSRFDPPQASLLMAIVTMVFRIESRFSIMAATAGFPLIHLLHGEFFVPRAGNK
jgi:hypothetical protein